MVCCSLEIERDSYTMLGADSHPGSISASKKRFPLQFSWEQGWNPPPFSVAEFGEGLYLAFYPKSW